MAATGRAHLVEEQGQPGLIVAAEARQIPFPSGSIDVVLAIDALHHIAVLSLVVGEIERLLRRGGLFVAIEPNVLNPIVLAAHLLPWEERGAVWPNHPWMVMRALRQAFNEVSVTPVTYVSGIQSPRALRFVELVEPLFQRAPLSAVALRRIYRARRR
jgi:SAM-dependent methyltransferase